MTLIIFNEELKNDKIYYIVLMKEDERNSTDMYKEYGVIITPNTYTDYDKAKEDCDRLNKNYNPNNIYSVMEVNLKSVAENTKSSILDEEV